MDSTSFKKQSGFWANFFKTPTENGELEDLLKNIPPFRNLNKKYLQIIIKLIHNRAYTAGEYIFFEGDPGIGLYIIRNGEVLITQGGAERLPTELARLSRGDFFGELALLDNDVRSASAIASTESNISVLFKPDLDEFIEKYPVQGVHILRGMAQITATRLRKINLEYVGLNDYKK
ncbi:MAG: cyclic nucleotide-binding domain-containing protein [bacterium]